jgi:hypothetical protein
MLNDISDAGMPSNLPGMIGGSLYVTLSFFSSVNYFTMYAQICDIYIYIICLAILRF